MPQEELIDLYNEYGRVKIFKETTPSGTRIKLVAPRLGHEIHLDPMELESLTWQSKDIFSEFLTTPFGPEK